MIDYKNTLNLPNTTFPMRANLVKCEHAILQRWKDDNLYAMLRQKKSKKKSFLLHDGPPYVNGNIHLGHAVNKVLKDIVLKSKNLSGYDTPYIPGWDCHGLPIELEVERIMGKPGVNVNVKEFQSACRNYVLEQIKIQKKDFMRLGVLADWNNPYLTMDFKVEANTIRTLNKVISGGYLYQGMKPIHWCFQCRSVLSESEIEYNHSHITSAIDVTFLSVDSIRISEIFNVNFSENQKIELVIWTTTPWTLPANQAIAVHPDYKYQLLEICINGNIRYVVILANLVKIVMDRIQCFFWKILGETCGIHLESLRFYHPFMSFDVPVVCSDHISLDSGTGIVHIAPNYGSDDYYIAKKYNFEKIINVTTDSGNYLINIHPVLDGVQIFKANNLILSLLNQSNSLLHVNDSYKHSYPYCWRHLKPVIIRATTQWFLSMERYNLRGQLLDLIRTVRWIPSKSESSITTMITNRPDWCISRQRVWGVPIPFLVHKYTKDLHPRTPELMEIIAQYVEENGIEAWWDLKIEDILKNSEESMQYKKIFDTLDVWFDSGATSFSVIPDRLNCNDNGVVISDLYLEGSDQYRGWFMSSLMISSIIKSQAPYKSVLSHGFTVDSQGHKMSKSLGNVVRPQEIIDNFGADILRLWIASSDYSKDMTISNKILKRVIDIYRRIRNTIRFCLSNIYDFDPNKDKVCPKNMVELDRWVVDKALSIQSKVISDYDQYNFHGVVKCIMQFCSIELGSFYLDVIKDRQYTTKKDSLARRSCQTALYHVIEAMTRWIAPILSFTADEVWRFIPGSRSKYIFTEEWYDGLFSLDDFQIMNIDYWNIFFKVRDEVNKKVEQARMSGLIKGSLDASVVLYASPQLAEKLRILGNELAFGLIISSVIIIDCDRIDRDCFDMKDQHVNETELGLKIVLKKAEGKKCLRCWHYKLDVGKNQNYNNICTRCVDNMIGIGEHRTFF